MGQLTRRRKKKRPEPADLTFAQRTIYQAIEDWYAKNDYAPSVRDVARLSNKTVSTAHVHLEALEKLGYIEREPSITRSIRLVK